MYSEERQRESEERRRKDRDWLAQHQPIVDVAWDAYTTTGEWPAVEAVQRKMDQQGLDLDVQRSLQELPQLPGELRSVTWNVVDIPLRVLRQYPAMGNVLPIIFQIIQHAVATYLSDVEDPKIRSDDPELTQLVPGRGREVWFVSGKLLFDSRPNLFLGASFGDDWWEFPINGTMARQMRGLQTIDDYFDRQAEVLADVNRQRTQVSLPIESLSTEPPSADGPATVFVLMPFSEVWSDDAYLMFKAATQRINLRPKPRIYRADEIEESGRITEQIVEAIRSADVVIADMTGLNPNVMWELGFAFAVDKEIVIANQDVTASPFDLREWRQVTYSTGYAVEERNALTRFLAAALGLPESDRLPIPDELGEVMGTGRYLVKMWEYQPDAETELSVAGWLDETESKVRELLGPTAEQLMLVFEDQRERRPAPASLRANPSAEFWHKAQARMDWLSQRISELS